MTKTIVGLYDQFSQAQEAVRELVEGGIPRENISMVANDAKGEYASKLQTGTEETGDNAEVGAGLGAVTGGIAGMLLGAAALAVPGIGPVLAAGPLVTAIGGAGLGALAGGVIGALTEAGVSREDADIYVEGVRRGGTLVTVYAADEEANMIAEVMNRHRPVDVQARAEEWRKGNWNTFDEGAEPFAFDRTKMDNELLARDRSGSQNEPGMTGDIDRATFRGTEPTMMEGYQVAEPRFRQHYDQRYGGRAENWDRFSEAYRFGFDHAQRGQFSNRSWQEARNDLRMIWEGMYPDRRWDDYEEAVNEGWLAGREK
jgi:hypothetical protein